MLPAAAAANQLQEADALLRQSVELFEAGRDAEAEAMHHRALAIREAVQPLLQPDEALVVFVVADEATFRFVLRQDRAEFLAMPVRRSAIELMIAALRRSLDTSGLSALSELRPYDLHNAHALYQTLFLAAAPSLAGAKRLLIVPDGVLIRLPSDASVRLTTGAIEALASEPAIGRAEALRLAMLAMLEDDTLPPEYAHPANWAPFSLVDEGGQGRQAATR